MNLRFSCALLFLAATAAAQPPGLDPGFGAGPGGGDRELLKKFDSDGNGWLQKEEREKAREFLRENPVERGLGFGPPPGSGPPEGDRPDVGRPRDRRPDFGRGFPPGMGAERPPAAEGVEVAKSSVESHEGDFYDPAILRTIFIDFDSNDWEVELEDFHGTDIEVPATLTVDGRLYSNCGISFRGMSSYGMVPRGYKRSLNISVDMTDDEQRIGGYKTLNLLNGASDDSMMSSVLYSHIARQYIPAPKANFVRVVINGRDWGVYTNVEQFNKDFVKENFGSGKGARWKVEGSPRGEGGLEYRGEELEAYRYPYSQKSGNDEDLRRLIELCRVLNQTPAAKLPAALEPIVDIDNLLWFLAIDNALINSDGYWIRASDYSIVLDEKSVFHFVPHDMNEAFRGGGGSGFPGGFGPGGPAGFNPRGFGPGRPGGIDGPPGRNGPDRADDRRPERRGERPEGREGFAGNRDQGSPLELDPLHGLDDPTKPLRSKVLAVPKYRDRYLANVRTIAEQSLDWKTIGPFVARQTRIIDPLMKIDTRKLSTYESFIAATTADAAAPVSGEPRRGHQAMNLKAFADGRRAYLLKSTSHR